MDVGGEIISLEALGAEGAKNGLAERFQRRAMDLAREGRLGSLFTRKASLRDSYASLVSLLDNCALSFLIYGESGSGKRRLIDEFTILHNFYRRLQSQGSGKLKVFTGSFVTEGFTHSFLAPRCSPSDVIYIEAVDELTAEHQRELLQHLKMRHEMGRKGIHLPRLIFGTERALSLLVIRKEFSRELFQQMTGFAIFLPSLSERQEDLPELVQNLVLSITGRLQSPPAWLIDLLSKQSFSRNIDELKKILQSGLNKNPEIAKWTEAELPENLRAVQFRPFDRNQPQDYTKVHKERLLLKQALLKAGGDRDKAAMQLNWNKVDFLKKLLEHGLR